MITNLHPDDVLFFNEVRTAMFRVAKNYGLPLRSVNPATMPETGMIDYLGRCFSTGDIELVMRATVDGAFCEGPRTPADVWRTAAHELTHLRHMNHGAGFQEFFMELMTAIDNQQIDHREKVIARLVKMQASRDGEAALGNAAAAEAFAGAINKMLIEYELNPSDLDYARATDKDPVIEIRVDLRKYAIVEKKARIAWQESLARRVAKAHLCTFLIMPGSNSIYFVGTKSHATVAEYVYGTLVPAATVMSTKERAKYAHEVHKRDGNWIALRGFTESWLDAFIRRIDERFEEARASAVAEVPVDSQSTALVRLNGALAKVQTYMDDKFKARRGSRAGALSTGRGHNAEGRARGRAAADRLPIGRRGVTGGATRGLLK